MKYNNVKFKWTESEKKQFDEVKQIVAHKTLLNYPDFKKKFDIHMDARNFQS